MRFILTTGLLVTGAASALIIAMAASQGDEGALTGTMSEEARVYSIEGTELDLGPERYLSSATAGADYDDDGTVEIVAEELDGLVGTTVTVENLDPNRNGGSDLEGIWKQIKRGDFSWPQDDDRFDVHTINGLGYRDPDLPPPWSGLPDDVEAPPGG